MVIWTHALSHLMFYGEPLIELEEIPLPVIIPFLPLILISTWAPIFALISGTASAYVTLGIVSRGKSVRKEEINKSLKNALKGALINGILLYVVSFIHMTMFHYSLVFNGEMSRTMITGSIELGKFILPSFDFLFFNDAIFLMAISGVIINIILYLLWRNTGYKQIKRNYIILTIIGVGFFALSPCLHLLDPLFFNAIDNGQFILPAVLRILIGHPHSTFPNAGFAFFGAILGIAIKREIQFKKIRNFGLIFGLGFIAVAIIIFINGDAVLGPELIGTSIPLEFHMINFGSMLIFTIALIGWIEYNDVEKRKKIAQRTIGIRRFSFIAMTGYVMETLLVIINLKWYLPLWNSDSFWIRWIELMLFCFMQLGIWVIIVHLWEKIDFKGSYEWFVVTVGGNLRGRKSNRLNVEKVLYNPIN
ncbi:MAG: hypothetical protein GF364_14470 [Candidatus Lokiarchaeota archaeon]|nr:hypothetical protein [Candidatus Lokiarchaeota archaeon]